MHNGMSMFHRDDDKLIITQDNLKQFDLFKTTWAKGNTRRHANVSWIGLRPSLMDSFRGSLSAMAFPTMIARA